MFAVQSIRVVGIAKLVSSELYTTGTITGLVDTSVSSIFSISQTVVGNKVSWENSNVEKHCSRLHRTKIDAIEGQSTDVKKY